MTTGIQNNQQSPSSTEIKKKGFYKNPELKQSNDSLSTAVSSQLLEPTEDKQNKQQPKLCSDKLYQLPEVARYFIAGIIGNVILYIFDQIFLYGNPIDWQKETVAWVLSTLFQTPLQYLLFEQFVYGKQQNRLKGIMSVYFTYSVSLVAGAVIEFVLVNEFEYTNDQAWVVTLCVTSFLNYALISKFLKSPFEKQEDEQEFTNDIENQNYFQNVEISDIKSNGKQYSNIVNRDDQVEQENELQQVKNNNIQQQQDDQQIQEEQSIQQKIDPDVLLDTQDQDYK